MQRTEKRIMRLIAALLAACLLGGFAFAGAGTYEFTVDDVLADTASAPAAAAEQSAYDFSAQSSTSSTPLPDPSEIHSIEDLPWYLTLVNSTHAVPEDWVIPQFTELRRSQAVDSRIYPQLQAMFDAARAEGIKPLVLTSYRTYDDQKAMLVSKYRKYRDKGMSESEAQEAALKVAAYPGYSEHQLGLAVDIDSNDTESCSNDEVWDWMKRHCHLYGFIWRYPGVKTEITGISNESWHFRYVGVEAATYIMENQLCLEEFLAQMYGIT